MQDIFSLFHLDRSFKFISKTSNFYIPVVGWSMFMTGKSESCSAGCHATSCCSTAMLRGNSRWCVLVLAQQLLGLHFLAESPHDAGIMA